jgi:putative endonuclease
MNENKKNTKKTGDLGERLAQRYLKNQGYTIVDTNFWRKWGEIDIIAKKDSVIHFIEVKTVSYETKQKLEYALSSGSWRPEEQVTSRKLNQMRKAIETWISDTSYKGEIVVDVLALRIVTQETYSTVNFIENVLIE